MLAATEDTEHYGHTFAPPRVSTSRCLGCGKIWSVVAASRRVCGQDKTRMAALPPLAPAIMAGIVTGGSVASIQKPIARRRLFGWLSDARKSG